MTASASIRNPQTFNRYIYVLNPPYKYTDPLGLLPMRNETGGCGAEYSSCSDDWGSSTWDDEEVPEQEETDEGVAENLETGGGVQQQAEEPEPPPPPSAEQNVESQAQQQPPAQVVTVDYDPAEYMCLGNTPTTITVALDSVDIESGSPDGSNQNFRGMQAKMTFTIYDQFGQPMEGSVTETVTNPQGNVITNPDAVSLVSGQFEVTVTANGGTVSPGANVQQIDNYILTNPARITQTATFRVQLANGPTLTIVQRRVLSNTNANGVVNRPNSRDNTFRFYLPSIAASISN